MTCFLYSTDKLKIYRYFGSDSSVVISWSVESLSCGCFRECKSVDCIEFGSGCQLKKIGRHAFQSVGLCPLILPRGLECLGRHSLSGLRCDRLCFVEWRLMRRLNASIGHSQELLIAVNADDVEAKRLKHVGKRYFASSGVDFGDFR